MDGKDGERINIVLLVVIVASVAALAIVFFYIAKFSGPLLNNDETSVVASEDNQNAEDRVIETDDIDAKLAACRSEGSTNQKDWCFLDLAKTYEVDACSEISQDQFKNYCEAIINRDDKKCGAITVLNVRDACYISLAQITGKDRYCNKADRVDFCKSLIP